MRVNYTLPGFLPAEPAPAEPGKVEVSPFRARLNFVPAPKWLNWKSLLHLDEAPVNAAAIGPPPRPAGIDVRDAAAGRLNWRQMLDRHVAALEEAPQEAHQDPNTAAAASDDTRAIERMLTLLMRFREVEDSIAARYLAEPEG